MSVVPRWNNREGGDELDTSRGFMGQERVDRLLALLPPHVDVVGIDEHTAPMVDFARGTVGVFGRGGASWLHARGTTRLRPGRRQPWQVWG